MQELESLMHGIRCTQVCFIKPHDDQTYRTYQPMGRPDLFMLLTVFHSVARQFAKARRRLTRALPDFPTVQFGCYRCEEVMICNTFEQRVFCNRPASPHHAHTSRRYPVTRGVVPLRAHADNILAKSRLVFNIIVSVHLCHCVLLAQSIVQVHGLAKKGRSVNRCGRGWLCTKAARGHRLLFLVRFRFCLRGQREATCPEFRCCLPA